LIDASIQMLASLLKCPIKALFGTNRRLAQVFVYFSRRRITIAPCRAVLPDNFGGDDGRV
jgi:hypothetical protein